MECLHGKPASYSTTSNGLFFFCGQTPSCHFFCSHEDRGHFQNALAAWRDTGCPQPFCHGHKILTKMRVVKDKTKQNVGRPFFVCSSKDNPCTFWQWGDEVRPNCRHGLPCCTRKVKKDGSNKGRLFHSCPNGKEYSCGYFEWCDKVEEKDTLEQLLNMDFSMSPFNNVQNVN